MTQPLRAARAPEAPRYLTLGHCRGHFDMRPVLDWWPTVERGSWELPVYQELLRRGLPWAKREAV